MQFKRYKDAKGTARALAKPKYEGMQKVGPSDQSLAGGFQACISVVMTVFVSLRHAFRWYQQ